ncbi:MAG: TlpA family protein disulfide reductase [Rikenella sp.]|nr:TlpA family protein disulfide reductase [Rikenella sp.]
MMKRTMLLCLTILGTAVAKAAGDRLPESLIGNWSSTDGSQRWSYGFYPTVAVWQNAFWEYAGTQIKGKTTEIRLRERGGAGREATLYARWEAKDSTARIGESPKRLIPYSRGIVSDPSYRIPVAEDPDYPAGDTLLHGGTAVVRGYLIGYAPESMPQNIKINPWNVVTSESVPAVGEIAPDGTFEAQVEVGHPLQCQISLARVFYDDLYLEPGDTLMVCYDLARWTFHQSSPQSRYMGTNGRVNHELNRLRQLYLPFGGSEYEHLIALSPDSALQWAAERVAADSAATAAYIAANGISRKGAFLARWTSQVLYAALAGDYAMDREQENPVDTAFFDFFRRLPLNDPRLLGVRQYEFMINRLEFCPIYHRSRGIEYRDLLRAGFEIAPDDLLRFDSLERNLYAVPGDSAATVEAIQAAWKKLEKYNSSFMTLKRLQTNDWIYQKGQEYWDVPMPFLNDLIAARQLHSSFNGPYKYFIPNRYWAQILGRFSTPAIIETLLDANDALRPVPVVASQGPYVPSDRAERLLDSLLREHRGRAVFVDFWATSCGPCRRGMIDSWKVKEELAGQPVDFVYITSTDQSPERVAAEFIEKNKITGRQIRLRPEEWNILSAKYRISGIPHYMIVGADGRVVDPHFRGYSSQVIVPALLKAAGATAEE